MTQLKLAEADPSSYMNNMNLEKRAIWYKKPKRVKSNLFSGFYGVYL